MKTYRYKDRNGNMVRSIFPKPTEEEEAVGDFFSAVAFIIFFIILITSIAL